MSGALRRDDRPRPRRNVGGHASRRSASADGWSYGRPEMVLNRTSPIGVGIVDLSPRPCSSRGGETLRKRPGPHRPVGPFPRLGLQLRRALTLTAERLQTFLASCPRCSPASPPCSLPTSHRVPLSAWALEPKPDGWTDTGLRRRRPGSRREPETWSIAEQVPGLAGLSGQICRPCLDGELMAGYVGSFGSGGWAMIQALDCADSGEYFILT